MMEARQGGSVMMEARQCDDIADMSTQEAMGLAKTISNQPDEFSSTVMLATTVRCFQKGFDNLNAEQRPELANVECQNGFSGLDVPDDQADGPGGGQHYLDEQAYRRRGGCRG